MDEFYDNYSRYERNCKTVIVPTLKSKVRSPIKFTNDKTIKVCFFYNGRNKNITYEKLMENK